MEKEFEASAGKNDPLDAKDRATVEAYRRHKELSRNAPAGPLSPLQKRMQSGGPGSEISKPPEPNLPGGEQLFGAGDVFG